MRVFYTILFFIILISCNRYSSIPISEAYVYKDKLVSVEFVVQSSHPLIPGEHYRLFSTPSFMDKNAFAVQFPLKKAFKMLKIKPESTQDIFFAIKTHYHGKRIRAKGRIESIMFSSIPAECLAIVVADPSEIVVLD
ncbi:MAG: hypothetical protein HUU50_08160 [Candidatus Brocadiae bacterium]|nr:hypothetical protein [Candidatus Brocadiia bacterium]